MNSEIKYRSQLSILNWLILTLLSPVERSMVVPARRRAISPAPANSTPPSSVRPTRTGTCRKAPAVSRFNSSARAAIWSFPPVTFHSFETRPKAADRLKTGQLETANPCRFEPAN